MCNSIYIVFIIVAICLSPHHPLSLSECFAWGQSINEQPKSFFEKVLIKSISQKGNNVYQNFKVTKIVPKQENGQDYMVCDFKYELLTGAGFEVDRIGVASVTSTGSAVEILWTASTRQRYKKTEEALRQIAESFRCYSDGLGMTKVVYGDDV